MKNHLKRLAMPRTWVIKRKGNVFLTRPSPSGHGLSFSLSLNAVLRDFLKYAKTTKEVRRILQEQEVFVDTRRKKDHRQALGFLDVLSIPALKVSYRLVFTQRGTLVPIKIDSKEETLKICKLTKKTLLKGGVMQLHFHDGKNLLLPKQDKETYHVGDSVLFDLKKGKIMKRLPFEKGMLVLLVGGSHVGTIGKVTDIVGDELVFESASGDDSKTLKSYAFVVGKETPLITSQPELKK